MTQERAACGLKSAEAEEPSGSGQNKEATQHPRALDPAAILGLRALPALSREMVNMQVCALDCETLRGLLKDRSLQCLVLDCRSFFSFNSSHIGGSSNVRLSTIVRRRAKGAMGLEHILPNEEMRACLRKGLYHAVVLLDERSADLESPKRDSTLLLAMNALCREARDTRICFLKGE